VLLERVIDTLTWLLGLIAAHPAFSRELNGLLPPFFTSLLNLSAQKSLLAATLKALHTLIPDHATTFRPNLTKTSQLTLSIIQGEYPPEIKRQAAMVYVDLHHSAPKGTNSEYWRSCLLGIVAEIHIVLDRLLEVVEEGITGQGILADLDRGRVLTAKGVGLKPLEGDYAMFMTSAIERIQFLIIVIVEFLR